MEACGLKTHDVQRCKKREGLKQSNLRYGDQLYKHLFLVSSEHGVENSWIRLGITSLPLNSMVVVVNLYFQKGS